MSPVPSEYAVISVQTPRPGFRDEALDSMQRYSAVARTRPGLVWTGVVDTGDGRLVGVAIWESEAAADAARPALMDEVGADPFDRWDAVPIEGFRGPAVPPR